MLYILLGDCWAKILIITCNYIFNIFSKSKIKWATKLHEFTIEFGITALSRKVYFVTSDFRWNIWIYGSFLDKKIFAYESSQFNKVHLFNIKKNHSVLYYESLKYATEFYSMLKKIRLLYSIFSWIMINYLRRYSNIIWQFFAIRIFFLKCNIC